MKTKTKSKTKRLTSRKTSGTPGEREPGKKITDRDLNEDEQEQVTNVEKEEEIASAPENNIKPDGFSVEEEEEREKRRQVEDVRPEEPMK
jgi:hypothetical protein